MIVALARIGPEETHNTELPITPTRATRWSEAQCRDGMFSSKSKTESVVGLIIFVLVHAWMANTEPPTGQCCPHLGCPLSSSGRASCAHDWLPHSNDEHLHPTCTTHQRLCTYGSRSVSTSGGADVRPVCASGRADWIDGRLVYTWSRNHQSDVVFSMGTGTLGASEEGV